MSKATTSENAMRGRSTPSSVNRRDNGDGAPITLPPRRWSAFSCMATKAPRRPHPASPSECAKSCGAMTTYRTADLFRLRRRLLMYDVLAVEGVPTSKAPSCPTEATTFPAVVVNTSNSGVISVTPTLSSAPTAERPAKARVTGIRVITPSSAQVWRKVTGLDLPKGFTTTGEIVRQIQQLSPD